MLNEAVDVGLAVDEALEVFAGKFGTSNALMAVGSYCD